MAKTTVTAAEFTRQFGHLRQALGDNPVHITHHGRETHVLLSASGYDDLRRRSLTTMDQGVMPKLVEFAEWLGHGVIILDAGGAIVLINGAARALLDCDADRCAGRVLWEAAPALAGSLIENQIRRGMESHELCTADLPSPITAGAWLRIEIHPAIGTTTVLLHDITVDVRRERLADEPAAVAAAVANHEAIAQLRLNPRGHIERANQALCMLVGLEEARLRGVAVVDLIPTRLKAGFRDVFDSVMSDGQMATLVTEILNNTGNCVAIRATLTELRGAYGQEGAVLIATLA